jgi:hypothetical protein
MGRKSNELGVPRRSGKKKEKESRDRFGKISGKATRMKLEKIKKTREKSNNK